MAEVVAENVDRLCTVEMRPQGMPRGLVNRLYDAARRRQGGQPLTLLAAERLRAAIKPGDNVVLVTGAGNPPWMPAGESDGPLGVAALARALVIGLGARPHFVTEAHSAAALAATVTAAGLAVVPFEMSTMRYGAATVDNFTADDRTARQRAPQLLDELRPAAVIACEKLGPNAKGEIHSVRGVNVTKESAKMQHLFAAAKEAGILTIGFGDGGNEIGCGVIYDDTRSLTEFGARCQCSCGDGMATTVRTDVLVFAAVSNWGAYGTSAMLGHLLGNPDLVHDPDTEYRMLDADVRAGGADGMVGRPVMKVDGISVEVNQGLVRQLREIVSIGLQRVDRPF